NCLNCGHNYKRASSICSINVNVILKNGLNSIQEALNDTVNMKNTIDCSVCKTPTSRVISYGPHLIFDTSVLSDVNYMKTLNISQCQYILDSVAKNIAIRDKNYSLAGIISYIRHGSGYNDGHYVAYTYTGLNWYKYDDMAYKRTIVTTKEEILPHVLIYVKC
ncbi:hypothetical protein ALC62_00023, partial [Cyphomyrmex costatus]